MKTISFIISFSLLLITILSIYTIWHITVGRKIKARAAKNKKEEKPQVKLKLNEIMGYEFIKPQTPQTINAVQNSITFNNGKINESQIGVTGAKDGTINNTETPNDLSENTEMISLKKPNEPAEETEVTVFSETCEMPLNELDASEIEDAINESFPEKNYEQCTNIDDVVDKYGSNSNAFADPEINDEIWNNGKVNIENRTENTDADFNEIINEWMDAESNGDFLNDMRKIKADCSNESAPPV